MTNKKPELVEMGIRLKELRDLKRKSQKEAAADLNLKPSVLSSYEVGDREPPITTLNNIARYYGVTVDYLTGNSTVKSQIHLVLNSEVGLNDKAISVLRSLGKGFTDFINEFINNKGFLYFMSTLYMYKYQTEDDLLKDIEKESAETTNERTKQICAFKKAQIQAIGKYSMLKPNVLNALDVILKEFEEE